MLKGSKIDNCQWSIQPISTKNFLTFEKDPSMYLQFQANKLIHNLQKVVESVDHFKYYMFSYKNEIRFLFITSEDVNFASVDKYSNRQETTFGIIVRGALYDIAFNRFIRFDGSRKGDVFYNFVIYDCGIPHIVFDEENESYVIGCSNRNRWTFLRTEYHEGPVPVLDNVPVGTLAAITGGDGALVTTGRVEGADNIRTLLGKFLGQHTLVLQSPEDDAGRVAALLNPAYQQTLEGVAELMRIVPDVCRELAPEQDALLVAQLLVE